MTCAVSTPLSDHAGIYPLPSVPIPRIPVPERAEFERDYLAYPGKPVIITGAMDHWPAMKKWTFAYFRELAGPRQVLVRDNLFTPTIVRKVSLNEFLFYCESPGLTALGGVRTPRPFYADFKPFQSYKQLLEDFTHPPFFANIYDGLSGRLQDWFLRQFSYLFIGPKGTLTKLHNDLFLTHAWLGQVVGRKHLLMFSIEDTPYLYDCKIDLLNPDLKRWPLLEKATCYEAILNPGEMIVFPSGWYHHVISLDPSISVSFNGVNETNYLPHILAIAQSLPRWARMVQTREFKEGLDIEWTFDDLKPVSQQEMGALMSYMVKK